VEFGLKQALMPHCWDVCLHCKTELSLAMTLTSWPVTLKTFSALLNHMMNICAKFHWNW